MGAATTFPSRPAWAVLAARYKGSGLLYPNCEFIDACIACRSRAVYLATPYSREATDLDGRWSAVRSDEAARQASKWALHAAVNGMTAVSPVLHAVAMLNVDGDRAIDPLDRAFWSQWCQPLLRSCGAIVVPPIPGWDVSRGVWSEVIWGLRHNIRVFVVRPGSEHGVCA